ncbi:potassium efflux system protein [Enterobacillus tribolii]|uniref:Potassium efflux system protein n=2 Tax=Enterobacillus tribolii TaxID=1487935 RepID=A0A370QSC7_9GAMM|nr:mechanosensitive channel MscK [Enterobacillus tribolii]RDK92158.1 potassium efflux system protein [Enterobacillus tribolii]
MVRWLPFLTMRSLFMSDGLFFRRARTVLCLFFSAALFFTLATETATAAPQLNSDVPSRADVQSQLDLLNKQKVLTPQEKLSQRDLLRVLEFLDATERVKQESKQLEQQIRQAPVKQQQAIDGLEALRNGETDEQILASLQKLSLRQLEQRISDAMDAVQDDQLNLSAFNSQLIALQTQPERVQGTMLNAAQQIQQIRNQLSDPSTLRLTEQSMLNTQLALLNQTLDFQRHSLEANTALQDSLQKQRDYTTAHLAQLEHMLQLARRLASDKRLTISENTAKEVQETGTDVVDIQQDPLVKRELETNRELSKRLIEATEGLNELSQENFRVKNWLDRSLQSERNLKEQISVLKGSLLLSRILYQQQQSLPTEKLTLDVASRIADLRLEQFAVNEQRDALFKSNDEYIAGLLAESKEKSTEDITDALGQIIDARRDLLDQLNRQLGNQLAAAISLQINQKQLTNVNDYLQKTLTQQIFWVSSNRPINLTWFKELPGALKAQFSDMHFSVKTQDLVQGALKVLIVLLPLLLVLGVLRWRYRKIDESLQTLADEVGQLKRDTQLHTPKAIALTLLKVLPGASVILTLGFWMYRSDFSISAFLWELSWQFALFWVVIGLTYNMLAPGSVFERHFNISAAMCAHYRRQTRRLGLALLPLIFWSVLGEKAPLRLSTDVFGQIVIFFTLATLSVLVFPMCRDAWREKGAHTVRLVLVTALALAPVVLIVLTACGYFYTALRLAGRWIDSMYLLIVWNIIYYTALRGLSVAARRLAYRRALARRQSNAVVREGAEGNDVVEEPPLAMDQINEQSLRLTTMVLFLAFASILYWIWADLVTVIAYLDSVSLWNYSSTSGGSAVVQAVTLGNVLFALITAVVVYILMRNLPGLLEVVILSRLNMRQGSSYAITTVLTYVIMVIGVVIFFGSLGISWDKLQWLAAALSVGLGFGLQEIFGNFISGLIILFERPVRIGDTITIGNFSGSVSRIRIRATTITDFDRKEVIIPNKAFVTERLINWSLSDTVTRVLIKVGVAYGSDLEKVKQVLLQAAKENPRVMTDPEPMVFFLAFGASTLDHELRLYVRELRDRSYVVDELNRRIDQLCRENGINIAFNQLEVYLHDQQGNEVKEVSLTKKDADAGDCAP